MQCSMIPIRPDIRAIREIDANHSRIEAAFQKYIHRSLPSADDEFAEDAEHDENHNKASLKIFRETEFNEKIQREVK